MTSTEPIYFLTGNANKVREISAVLPQVKQLNIDLPEIQELDARKIIEAKVQAAFAHHSGPFIVEDTSLTIEGMNGLPGPLIKWFIGALQFEQLVIMARELGPNRARATTFIGYAVDIDRINYFQGSLEGKLVSPRGTDGFGWDPIFQPDGSEQTLAEMGLEAKNAISYRRLAVDRLATALGRP